MSPKMHKSLRIFVLGCSLFLFACESKNRVENKVKIKNSDLKKPLLKANRGLVNKENAEIDSYVLRRNWKMKQTGSGLRYRIYHQGNGANAEAGKFAFIKYKITLLNGTECYRNLDKPERFLIDRDNVESGLHEGIKLLHVGDKATFILPPHLAHGLIGDREKIPPLSTIIYDVELVSIK